MPMRIAYMRNDQVLLDEEQVANTDTLEFLDELLSNQFKKLVDRSTLRDLEVPTNQ
jgi:hypothetical protein